VSRLTIRVPRGFDFWRTALSHGWGVLPPFESDARERTLCRVFRLEGGTIVTAVMSGSPGAVRVDTGRGILPAAVRSDLRRQARTILRLDEDFTEFHTAARRLPAYRWIASSGSGRLLRAPSPFEDIVKMICTTNCSWSLTKLMVERLVALFGERAPDGRRAFPEPAAIAASTEKELRARCSTGYRAPYVLELSRRAASGELDLDSFRTSDVPVDELFSALLSIKGVGPYAAGNLLKLMGRYDHLGLDSWVRGQYARLHCGGRRLKDSTIERRYRQFGRWRGLFFWLEMTRSWHDEKFRAAGERTEVP
jgi:N-glycosylase/DNA lyase